MADILTLITARGGSKSIPKKNIVPLAGKPLIAWTIEAAVNAGVNTRVIVSTDDDEIARISERFGAQVLFMRPAELARDDSSHLDVVVHAIKWLQASARGCEAYVMLLQPTSPLRTAGDIDAAVEILLTHNAHSVISVCEIPFHLNKMTQISEKGNMTALDKYAQGYLPRQCLDKTYHENGAIYLLKTDTLLAQREWYPRETFPYIMPPERSLDIDTPWDLHLADLILRDKYGVTAPVGTSPAGK